MEVYGYSFIYFDSLTQGGRVNFIKIYYLVPVNFSDLETIVDAWTLSAKELASNLNPLSKFDYTLGCVLSFFQLCHS